MTNPLARAALCLMLMAPQAAHATNPCAPLQGTDQAPRCQNDQLRLLSQETAQMQAERLGAPPPRYDLQPERPPLSPFQEGYDAQRARAFDRLTVGTAQRSLQLQQRISRDVTRALK